MTKVILNHKHQKVHFAYGLRSVSDSFVESLFKPRYRMIQIGELYEALAKELMSATRVRTNVVDFTLVNVCSPFYKISHGVSEAPEEFNWPRNPHLIFTFACSQDRDASTLGFSTRRLSNNVVQWSTKRGPNAFISIGFNSVQCSRLGMPRMNALDLRYIYNLIGMMTKALLLRNYYGKDPEDLYSARDLTHYNDRFKNMRFQDLVESVAYPFWVFSKSVWDKCPNVLASSHITPSSALYYFMYLVNTLNVSNVDSFEAANDRLIEIEDKVKDSVMELVQRAKAKNSVQLTRSDLIAPCAISSALNTGRPKMEFRKRVWLKDLELSASSVIESFDENSLSVLLPVEQIAKKLMKPKTDEAFLDRIADAQIETTE